MKVMERTETETEQKTSYWTDKNPCWEACHCPSMIKDECPATRYQFLACWEIEGTYCKLNDYGATGKDTSICEVCRVYKKYGKEEPIQLKLLGRGINTKIKDLEKISQR